MGHGSAYGGVEGADFRLAWLLSLCLLALPACGRVDEAPSRESVSHASQAVSASTKVILRQVGEAYEIEVRGERALIPLGENDPALRVGSTKFRIYKPSSDASRGVIYPISATQFAELPDGAEVRVVYGDGPGRVYGSLTKSAVEVLP